MDNELQISQGMYYLNKDRVARMDELVRYIAFLPWFNVDVLHKFYINIFQELLKDPVYIENKDLAYQHRAITCADVLQSPVISRVDYNVFVVDEEVREPLRSQLEEKKDLLKKIGEFMLAYIHECRSHILSARYQEVYRVEGLMLVNPLSAVDLISDRVAKKLNENRNSAVQENTVGFYLNILDQEKNKAEYAEIIKLLKGVQHILKGDKEKGMEELTKLKDANLNKNKGKSIRIKLRREVQEQLVTNFEKNRVEQYFLKASSCVGWVDVDSKRMGNGIILKGGYLLTVNHLIPSSEEAKEAKIIFYDRKDGDPTSYGLSPEVFFETSSVNELDYTIVKINDKDNSSSIGDRGYLEFNLERSVKANSNQKLLSVYYTHEKELVRLEGKQKDFNEKYIIYDLLTEKGASGAPILDMDGKILGLHIGTTNPLGTTKGNLLKRAIWVPRIADNLGARGFDINDLGGKPKEKIGKKFAVINYGSKDLEEQDLLNRGYLRLYGSLKNNKELERSGIVVEHHFCSSFKDFIDKIKLLINEHFEELYLHFGNLTDLRYREWIVKNEEVILLLNNAKIKFSFFVDCPETTFNSIISLCSNVTILGNINIQKKRHFSANFQERFYSYLSSKKSFEDAFKLAFREISIERELEDQLGFNISKRDGKSEINSSLNLIFKNEKAKDSYLIQPSILDTIEAIQVKDEEVILIYSANENVRNKFEQFIKETGHEELNENVLLLGDNEVVEIVNEDTVYTNDLKVFIIIDSVDDALKNNSLPAILETKMRLEENQQPTFVLAVKKGIILSQLFGVRRKLIKEFESHQYIRYSNISDLFTNPDVLNFIGISNRNDFDERLKMLMSFPCGDTKGELLNKNISGDYVNLAFFVAQNHGNFIYFLINWLVYRKKINRPKIIVDISKNGITPHLPLIDALERAVTIVRLRDSIKMTFRETLTSLLTEGHIFVFKTKLDEYVEKEIEEVLLQFSEASKRIKENREQNYLFFITSEDQADFGTQKSLYDGKTSRTYLSSLKPFSSKEFQKWIISQRSLVSKALSEKINQLQQLEVEEYENGDPSKVLEQVCDILEVPRDDIFLLDGNFPPETFVEQEGKESKFYDQEAIIERLKVEEKLEGETIQDNLLIFSTKKQQSWLITTNKKLYFLLEDEKTRQNKVVQLSIPLKEAISNIKAGDSRKGGGAIRIGSPKRKRWYYSKRLFPKHIDIEKAVKELVDKAIKSGEASTTDNKILVAFADENDLDGEIVLTGVLNDFNPRDFILTEDVTVARFFIHVKQDFFILSKKNIPLQDITEIPEEFEKVEGNNMEAAEAFVFSVERVAKWTKTLELKGQLKSVDALQLEIQLYRSLEPGVFDKNDVEVEFVETRNQVVAFEYEKINGAWELPGFSLYLRNKGDKRLFVSVLYLGSDFSIRDELLETMELKPNERISASTNFRGGQYDVIPLRTNIDPNVEGPLFETDYIKIIASAEPFDTKVFNQEGLPYVRTSSSGREELIFNPIEWASEEITLTVGYPIKEEQKFKELIDFFPNKAKVLILGDEWLKSPQPDTRDVISFLQEDWPVLIRDKYNDERGLFNDVAKWKIEIIVISNILEYAFEKAFLGIEEKKEDIQTIVEEELDRLLEDADSIIKELKNTTTFILHGYDYFNVTLLQERLNSSGNLTLSLEEDEIQRINVTVIDAINNRLMELEEKYPNVVFIDFRGKVGSLVHEKSQKRNWSGPFTPNEKHSELIANIFKDHFEKLGGRETFFKA